MKLVDQTKQIGVRANCETRKMQNMPWKLVQKVLVCSVQNTCSMAKEVKLLCSSWKMIVKQKQKVRETEWIVQVCEERCEGYIESNERTSRYHSSPRSTTHEFVPHDKEKLRQLSKELGISMGMLNRSGTGIARKQPDAGTPWCTFRYFLS